MSNATTEVDVIELYLHSRGSEDPELLEIRASAQVRELTAPGADGDLDLIWLEEADEPLDLEVTLVVAGIGHRRHVHRGRCRSVATSVRYGGDAKEHPFSPAATVERVFEWATGKSGFDLTPAEKAKHVLALPGADHPLDSATHIGSLVGPECCDVLLDLAPKSRFEG